VIDLSRILEGVIIAGLGALVVAGLALARTVSRLAGVVENGLTDRVERIENQVDRIYDHLLGE
jgi:hypothetical protein